MRPRTHPPRIEETIRVSALYLRTIGWAYLADHLPTPLGVPGWSSQAALELGTLIAECGEAQGFSRWLGEGAL